MNKILSFCFSVSILVIVSAKELTDDDYYHLPDLYHFDDYDKCLSQRHGLFCLGTFELTPTDKPNAVYDLIRLYSEDKGHFNRSIINRGWCVSSRDSNHEDHPERRFTRCGEDWARSRNMKAQLQNLDYCKTHEQYKMKTGLDVPETIFLYVIGCIFLLNIIGTVYDLWIGSNPNKNKYIMAWSVPSNWSRLTSPYTSQDPRLSSLAPIQGARVIVMIIVLWAHVFFSHGLLYLQNPRDYEKDMRSMQGTIIFNGTSLVQMFVMFSSFFCAYNLLLPSDKRPLSISMFPKQLIKRYIRITPMYMLLVSYGATWWIYSREGPQWSSIVGGERNSCRKKFWSHALYLNNFYEQQDYCFIQTWFLAVDMQLYIAALLLTLFLAKFRRHALRILAILYVTSCVALGLLSYFKNYSSMLNNALPDYARVLFINTPSFYQLYVNPLNSLPSCLMGLFLAHLLYQLHENGYKFHNNKWLKYSHQIMILVYIMWLMCGMYFRELRSNIATSLFVAIERFLFGLMFIIIVTGYTTIQSPLQRMFAWRGWDMLAKMSLSVMMIHWVIIMIIIAPRHTTTYTSGINVCIDTAATVVFTYILAVPASVMVELPLQRFLDNFIR